MIAVDGTTGSLTRRLLARGRHTRAFGFIGEELVKRMLKARGYKVRRQHRHYAGDLRAVTPDGEIINVEVKTARAGVEGNYQFCLYRRLDQRVCTDARHSDVIVLLCVTTAGQIVPFVVPAAQTDNLKQITITSNPVTYRGWLARYRQQVESISLEVAR